jgi:predicted TIM-barrel fold metal-dependent hydrolase
MRPAASRRVPEAAAGGQGARGQGAGEHGAGGQGGLLPFVRDMALADHHCHGVIRRDVRRGEFEAMLTEADDPGQRGTPGLTMFDSQIGLAVRRWCPPVLGLPEHTEPDEYLGRRAALGHAEVSRRFLRAAGLAELYVDTGFEPEPLLSPPEMAGAAGGQAHEIVRLEQVAESVAAAGTSASAFAGAFRETLAGRARHAAGVKSVAAYRVGLDLPAARPTDAEVAAAAARWLGCPALAGSPGPPETPETPGPAGSPGAPGGAPRLADPVLHTFLIWCGADLGLPIQFHVGYGDRDIDLHRCNPLLLTALLRAIEPAGVPVMLLHNYPYHREAGYLAQVFPHVYMDAGLATHNLGHRATALIAECLELVPFGKFLYSSDGFGLPELHYLGAVLFRRGLSSFLRAGLGDGAWTEADAARIARLTGYENARRVYSRQRAPG